MKLIYVEYLHPEDEYPFVKVRNYVGFVIRETDKDILITNCQMLGDMYVHSNLLKKASIRSLKELLIE
jgi:hypothetical protein